MVWVCDAVVRHAISAVCVKEEESCRLLAGLESTEGGVS